MTKDIVLLIEELKSNTQYHDTDIYKFYEETINVNKPKAMFDLLYKIGDLPYDFFFLEETSETLNVKRKDVQELLVGLCEIIAEKIEAAARETFIIEYTPQDIRLYSIIDDYYYNQDKLQHTDYSRCTLDDKKVLNTDWFFLYEYRLIE